MPNFAPASLGRRPKLGLVALALAVGLLPSDVARAQVGRQAVPTITYYAAKHELYAGNYADALQDFVSETRGGIKTAQSSWIDSICYRAMLGECYYHMGNYPKAMDNYNAALRLYVAFSGWMLRVQFPITIGPDNSRGRQAVPWGPSTRQFALGRVPNTMSISQGRINNNQIVQQGGVVQKAILFPIRADEIVRCTALALRRRAELMGPICKHDPLTDEALASLARRPAPANHWSQAWIDLQLGLAQVGAGQLAQAQQSLQRAIVVGGQYDHPLTCVALLELGRIALEAGDFNAAARLCLEASISAYYFENVGVLTEALQLGFEAHVRSNQQGLYPPLAMAARWAATTNFRHLQVWLGALTAENYALMAQPAKALGAANAARTLMGGRAMAASTVAARLNYARAIIGYERGRADEGTAALTAALAFQRGGGSRWLYRVAVADSLFAGGAITPRTAMDLYAEVLRDPGAKDWSARPLEALSFLAGPLELSYENWFQAALLRKEPAAALQIADRARRHRFYSSLPMWGRVLALRGILETPPDQLTPAAAVQRQDLLVHYPNYDRWGQQAEALRVELRREPLAPADEEAARKQGEALTELAKLSALQEAVLREMALRREPADLIFPPLVKTEDAQAKLPKGTCALVFFQTTRGLYGFLLSNARYAAWRIKSPAAVQKALVKLLRDLGNYDANRELTLKDLQNDAWRTSARELSAALFEDSQIDLSQGIEELVIVPDGLTWYVPFEALPLGAEEDAPPLLSKIRVRYVPTFALAAPDAAPRRRGTNMAVVTGKLSPGQKDGFEQLALDKIRHSVPEAVKLQVAPSAEPNWYRALIDRLVVLNDLTVDPAAPYAWAPLALERGRSTAGVAGWFSLPWGYPDQIVLPGFHTAAEHAMKRPSGAMPGQELFLASCLLMSGGSRTILLSRWRTGGETSVELAQQFVQELPYLSAAEAWQRSVELAKEEPLNWETEPRLKRFDSPTMPTAKNPFFWAGYVLIDTGAEPRDPNAAPAQPAAPPVLDFNKLKEKKEAEAAKEKGEKEAEVKKEMPNDE
jgi:CHAT domain-containing protein